MPFSTSPPPSPRRSHAPEQLFRFTSKRESTRFYDLNIWSEKKRLEKLTYMHNNPVKRGLAKEPGDWPWSSWRFYYREDASLLAMDRAV